MTKPMIILVGPSAVGKTTVANLLVERYPDRFAFVRSVTTRPSRFEGDTEYIYITQEEYDALVENDGLLEYATYAAFSYGTPRSEIERIEKEGKTPLLVLNIEGVKSLRKKDDLKVYAIYFYEDLNLLETRLYERGLATNPSVENLTAFVKRKNQNIEDYLHIDEVAPLFDLFYENHSLDASVEMVLSLIDGECQPMSEEKKSELITILQGRARDKLAVGRGEVSDGPAPSFGAAFGSPFMPPIIR